MLLFVCSSCCCTLQAGSVYGNAAKRRKTAEEKAAAAERKQRLQEEAQQQLAAGQPFTLTNRLPWAEKQAQVGFVVAALVHGALVRFSARALVDADSCM
jgi:hypothetical protein